jgi:hypothetical protein
MQIMNIILIDHFLRELYGLGQKKLRNQIPQFNIGALRLT